jgi:hypothetical protein
MNFNIRKLNTFLLPTVNHDTTNDSFFYDDGIFGIPNWMVAYPIEVGLAIISGGATLLGKTGIKSFVWFLKQPVFYRLIIQNTQEIIRYLFKNETREFISVEIETRLLDMMLPNVEAIFQLFITLFSNYTSVGGAFVSIWDLYDCKRNNNFLNAF